jgi:hypothetical protein
MDPRTYVTLEQSLIRRLRKSWRAAADEALSEIAELVEAGKYDDARAKVLGLDLYEIGQQNRQYIRHLGQSCVVFGAASVSAMPGVLLDPLTPTFLDKSTNSVLTFLEFGGTSALHRTCLQLIAQAEQSVQKAEATPRKVRQFVSFQEAGDEQLQLISSLHTSRLAVWGFAAEAEITGVSRYRLNAVIDGRTSKFCRMIHGKEFNVSDAKAKIMEVLSVDDPEALKTIQPWPKQTIASLEQISAMTEAELVAHGWHIPPFHPSCRTLLSLVSKLSRIVKPSAQPSPDLPHHLSTEDDFKAAGIDLTTEQLDHWNTYIAASPAEWLAKLSGKTPLDALEGVFGKNAIKVLPDGDIVTTVKGMTPGGKFKAGMVFDPYAGRMYLSQAEFIAGDIGAEQAFMKSLLKNMVDASKAVSGSAVVVSVGQNAFEFGKLGFKPNPAQWQEMRVEMMERLTEGDLKKLLSSLDEEKQQLLLNLLGNQDEAALGILVDLPWTYRGKSVARILLEEVTGTFELDLTSVPQVSKAMEYLS